MTVYLILILIIVILSVALIVVVLKYRRLKNKKTVSEIEVFTTKDGEYNPMSFH